MKDIQELIKSKKLSGADLRGADLREADLKNADLSGTNLSIADLRGADLRGANLKDADLNSADLRGANLRDVSLNSADLRGANLKDVNLSSTILSKAKTDKRYIQISCIGSIKRQITYCFEDDIIWCGCFTGSLEEFEAQVNVTHKNNPQFLNEYLGFINYLKSLM